MNTKINRIITREIKAIKEHPVWITAWWKSEYQNNRKKELLKDISNKNPDYEFTLTH